MSHTTTSQLVMAAIAQPLGPTKLLQLKRSNLKHHTEGLASVLPTLCLICFQESILHSEENMLPLCLLADLASLLALTLC